MIVIDNNSTILKTLKWSFAFILKNTAATILRKHYTTHAKKRVILGGERVLYTGPSLIAFSTNAWFRCCFRRPSALSSFPPLCITVFGHPVFASILVEDVVNTFGLFVWHWFGYLRHRLLPLGRLAFVLACHLGFWMPYLRGLKLGDITTYFVCGRS